MKHCQQLKRTQIGCWLGWIRYRIESILEIGIGTPETVGYYGSSLKMWSEFFPSAIVVGCDIDKIAIKKKYLSNYIILKVHLVIEQFEFLKRR